MGVACMASAAAMWLAPMPMARVYRLPPRKQLLAALAARDLVIGAGLLSGAQARAFWAARALADASDAATIAAYGWRKHREGTALRVAIALLLSGFAIRTCAHRATNVVAL